IKVHHCVIDGASGVEILTALMSTTADQAQASPEEWIPRREPTTAELLRDELRHHATIPLDAVRAARQLAGDPRKFPDGIAGLWSGVRETLSVALRPPAQTPLNQPVGSARRVSWTRLDLDAVKTVKNRL